MNEQEMDEHMENNMETVRDCIVSIIHAGAMQEKEKDFWRMNELFEELIPILDKEKLKELKEKYLFLQDLETGRKFRLHPEQTNLFEYSK